MNAGKSLFTSIIISLLMLSYVRAQEAEKQSFDSVKFSVDRVETVHVQLESVELRKEKLPLAKELFPDNELAWTATFKGRMTDCVIAEKSGHVVIGMVQNWEGFVYVLDSGGKILWKKESSINSGVKKCGMVWVDISDNGTTIGINWSGDWESIDRQVYDISGEKLFGKLGSLGPLVEISPEGKYVNLFGISTRYGNAIELRQILQGIPRMEPSEHFNAFAFASDSEFVVLLRNNMYLYAFPGGELKWKTATEFRGQIVTSENYILLGESEKVSLFDRNGGSLWIKELGKKTHASSFSFSENENYIGIHAKGRCDMLLLLDIKTANVREKIQFGEGNVDLFPPYFLCLNEIATVSGIAGYYIDDREKRKGYYTYFLKFNDSREIIDNGWRKGLVIGTSDSPLIAIYESDATDTHRSGGENSTKFTIDILERRDKE